MARSPRRPRWSFFASVFPGLRLCIGLLGVAGVVPLAPETAYGAPARTGKPKDHGEAPPRPITPGEKVVVAYLELGQKKFAEGDMQGALTAFEKARATDPKDARPLYMRATVYQKLGKLPEAIADFRAALSLNPKLVDVRAELGAVLTDSGKPEEAVPILEAAVAEKPDHFEAHFNLGVALETLGKWVEAEKAYRRASTLKPGDADVRLNLAVALRKTGRAQEALEVAKEAVRLAPDDAQAHLNLGLLMSEVKRYDEAAVEITAATRLAPTLQKAWWRLGVVEMRRENAKAALLALSKAKSLRPSPDVITDVGLAKRKLGDIKGAEAEFQEALRLDGKYHTARIHLLATWSQTGRCKDVGKELPLIPEKPEYQESLNRIRSQCQFVKKK